VILVNGMSKKDLLKEFREHFASSHYDPAGEEAYDFNIKMQKINIPKVVRSAYSQDAIQRKYEVAAVGAVEGVKQYLEDKHDWIEKVLQTGRSGGWLTVVTERPVFLDEAKVSEMRDRIADLRDIEKDLKIIKGDFIRDMESTDFWEIGPRDWSPRWKE